MEIPEGRLSARELAEFFSQLPPSMPVTSFRARSELSCVIVDKSGAAQLVRDEEGGWLHVIVKLD